MQKKTFVWSLSIFSGVGFIALAALIAEVILSGGMNFWAGLCLAIVLFQILIISFYVLLFFAKGKEFGKPVTGTEKKICPECFTENEADAKVCKKCGHLLP